MEWVIKASLATSSRHPIARAGGIAVTKNRNLAQLETKPTADRYICALATTTLHIKMRRPAKSD
jgi:hypothetical protein